MTADDAANDLLRRLCDARYEGFGIVYTDSDLIRRIPKRRAVTREKEQRRLADVVGRVVTHLRGEGGSVTSAAAIAEPSGFAASIRVARGYAQLFQAVAERFRAGDNVWSDNPDPHGGLIVLHFWYDPTHRRL